MALQKFPGLIDIHVHLRDPGATHKEDFASGARAALAGGFTYVCDMPNNYAQPTFSAERLEEKIRLSEEKSIIDIGFHFGTVGKNLDQFAFAIHNPHVFGLKIYCGETTGDLIISDSKILDTIFAAWNSDKPILVHADGALLQLTIGLAKTYQRRLHVCHVIPSDLPLIRKAKENNLPVTAGVTPHHLYLSDGLVKPPLVDEAGQIELWKGIASGVIDIVESDHAPHTREEKESDMRHFGVPGLETTLGLLLLGVKKEKLSIENVINLLYANPKRIFSIPDQSDTFIELDPEKPFTVGSQGYQTKCQWSPFDGYELFGHVKRVVLYGRSLVENGKIV